MDKQKISNYVNLQLARGIPKEAIRNSLSERGYDLALIDEVLVSKQSPSSQNGSLSEHQPDQSTVDVVSSPPPQSPSEQNMKPSKNNFRSKILRLFNR